MGNATGGFIPPTFGFDMNYQNCRAHAVYYSGMRVIFWSSEFCQIFSIIFHFLPKLVGTFFPCFTRGGMDHPTIADLLSHPHVFKQPFS
jgi:hypothetical protein